MADRYGIEKVMLISVGSERAGDLKTLTGLADTQLKLGGNLMKFMGSIRSAAEMDQLVNVNHVGPMDQKRLDQDLLPHIQGKCPGKRVSATCVQDPNNPDVAVYCVVIHAGDHVQTPEPTPASPTPTKAPTPAKAESTTKPWWKFW